MRPPLSTAPLPSGFGDSRYAAQVYGTRSCGYTLRALHLLREVGIETDFVDLGKPGGSAQRRALQAETDHFTVPFVYLHGRFIGGFTELDELRRRGELNVSGLTPRAHT